MTCDPNRRSFLIGASAASAAATLASRLQAQEPAPPAPADQGVPTVTLGKTGRAVTKLGMGTSWSVAPSFVQAALNAGVAYIDTSETYENTAVERTLGQVLERTGRRKDVYLVTKTEAYRAGRGDAIKKTLSDHLDASLERLRTDYADAYYLHGLSGRQIGMLKDPAVKSAFEALKKSGKIRFAGFSCHDAQLPELMTVAAEVGWIDQIMLKYSFRTVGGIDRGYEERQIQNDGGADRSDDMNRALDAASKANIGLVAMKTQAGASSFPDRIADLVAKGFKKEVAAIKSVWMDDRIQVVVSEMTTRDQLLENVAASREPLTPKEARLLEEHRQRTAHLFCHGCEHICGAPVADTLRFLRYETAYGKRATARRLYQSLPDEVRNLPDSALHAAERACPHGLPLVQLIGQARDRLS
jgi:predicted aldo/keto reductase-like oxidoreductase